MLPTPSTSHVDFDRIYEPAEDSYLLLDTLSAEVETTFLKQRFPPSTPSPLVLEVGTGSGVVLAFVTANANHIFSRSDIAAIGTDANSFACDATTKTVQVSVSEQRKSGTSAGSFCDCVNGDLTTALKPHSIDILIFNPPYVPTEALPDVIEDPTSVSVACQDDFARDSRLLALSYAGGIDGMETTNRLLDQLPETLSKRGVAYILLCKQNRPEAVLKDVLSWSGGWSAAIVGSSGNRAGWERLCILRIWQSEAAERPVG